MAFEKVTGGSARKLAIGESVEGLVFKIDEEQGQKKNSKIYHIEQKDGSVIRIWGAAIIDSALSEYELPIISRITLTGKGKTAAGQGLNLYTVEVDLEGDKTEYPIRADVSSGPEEPDLEA